MAGQLPEIPRRRDPIWDAVVEVFKLSPVTSSELRRVGRVVRDLKLKGALPEDVSERAHRYMVKWPTITLTPEALLKHWDMFADQPSGSSGRAHGGADYDSVF